MATPGCASTYGTSASTRRRRGPTSGRGLTRAPASADRAEPCDKVGAELVGPEHLGVVEEVEHPRAERGAVHHRQRHLDSAVGAALDHGFLAELLDDPARA